MFIDEKRLVVRSGKGGDGITAWRREKRVPRGGPAGGDGGRGGSVILLADSQLTTFGDMEAIHVARAQDGERGGGNKRHGAKGADRVVHVPVGTTIYDDETGNKLKDLVEDQTRWIAARGGKGGLGNARFATATDQAPTRSTLGRAGRERKLRLQLRLLADVGLIGLPNAGKSTFLSRVSAATPKIADYPFTTLDPHLGIVDLPDYSRFVLADLPGLIEGASGGHGLGDRFLRHVERTRVLLHLVDPMPMDGSDPVANYRTIRGELEAYGRGLADRPELVALTKADVWPPEGPPGDVLSRLAEAADRRVHPVSAVTGQGVQALLRAVVQVLSEAPPAPEVPDGIAKSDEGGEPAGS
ncbi:MAG: GTPase ObgE [Planctomycetota bacterium]|nr:GTPase ObgE [Planctomycetota bacterium]